MNASATIAPCLKGSEVPHLLVVDDDENLVTNLAAFLETHRFRVESAHDMEGALQAVMTRRVGLALIDYRLGRQNGAEVILAIRRRLPDFPIILMSAFIDDWTQALLQARRPNCYLKKPFSSTEVLSAIAEALLTARSGRMLP